MLFGLELTVSEPVHGYGLRCLCGRLAMGGVARGSPLVRKEKRRNARAINNNPGIGLVECVALLLRCRLLTPFPPPVPLRPYLPRSQPG